MSTNRVCWWEIGTQDAKSLASFYARVFGWQASEFGDIGYQCLSSGTGKDGGIGGGIFTVEGKCAPYQTVYVEVADVDAMLKTAIEVGAQSLGDPMDIPGVGRVAMLKDPQGHTLGLITPTSGEKQAD